VEHIVQVLTITDWDEEGQWASLSYQHNRRFTDYLKLGITPVSFRRYNSENRTWQVHLSKLPLVVGLARRYFSHVDYSSLPEWVQMLLAASKDAGPSWAGPKPQVSTECVLEPYTTLYLLPTAPWEVIQAAYKALATLNHPDHGGSELAMKKINCAYAELQKRR
jgi:hypothetical protein